MNKTDEFVDRAATYMAADRPDIFDVNRAKETLYDWIKVLEEYKTIASAGFMLSKSTDEEGYVEYSLVRQVLDLQDANSHDADIFDWTTSSRGFNK